MKRILSLLWLVAVTLPLVAQANHNFEVAKNLDIFNAFYKELDLYYVDTLDAQRLVQSAIGGMLDELDPYTEFYSEKSREDLKQMTTGKYAGIGAIIQYNKKNGPLRHRRPVCRQSRRKGGAACRRRHFGD